MTIFQKKEKILRQLAKEIPINEIKSPKIKKIIKEMKEDLSSQDDGVAIAAPQIGVSLRIFVVSGKIFHFGKTVPNKSKVIKEQVRNDSRLDSRSFASKDLVFINPKIVKLSKKKKFVPEGCLSVRWLYGEVKRSTNATILAYDEKGEKFTRGAGGLLAQIFQHETDHLDGILFTDKARNLKEMPPESVNQASKRSK